MVSIGKEAYVTTLIADNVTCSGSVTAANKIFGIDEKNLGEMHHNGSMFYIKWSAVHQITSITTTNNSNNVVITTSAPHGLSTNDTVHISSLLNDLNGIPATEITGSHIISVALFQGQQTTFSFTVNTTANNAGTFTSSMPLLRVDRYRYTDMNSSTVTWNNSTTLPTPTHTNIETFYY